MPSESDARHPQSFTQIVGNRVASACAVGLLGAQLVGVVRGPFSSDRYFSWAPHDQRTQYTLTARHGHRDVSPDEIRARYALPVVEWHHWGNIQAVIRTAEGRRAPADRWDVRLRYRVNRQAPQDWCFPQRCAAND